jgi:hypothetical protein
MLTIDQMRALLKPMVMTKVAQDTGLSYDKLHRFRNGGMHDPSHVFITKLNDYLEDYLRSAGLSWTN